MINPFCLSNFSHHLIFWGGKGTKKEDVLTDTFYYITGQRVGANKVSEFPAVGLQDGMTVALPQKFSF
jgi:hypothetical protein